MVPFDPKSFGFTPIDYAPAPGLTFYEYRNHELVDGRTDVLRLNIYMSRDGAFTCIWNGLLEPTMTQGMFALEPPADLDFKDLYCEQLFRGYIETKEEAEVILRALRIEDIAEDLPQVLRGAPSDLICEAL